MEVGDIVRVYRQAPSNAVVGIGVIIREHTSHGPNVWCVCVDNSLRWVWPCNMEVVNATR